METTAVYLIFAFMPLEMEGSDKFIAVAPNEKFAEEAVSRLNEKSKQQAYENFADSWHKVAPNFYYKAVSPSYSIDAILEKDI